MNLDNNLKPIINAIKKIIPLKEAYLFGSYAYGTPSEDSDYDIYLIVDEIIGSKHDNLVSLYGVVQRVANKPTDILLNTKSHFDERKNYKGTIEYKIANYGIKLLWTKNYMMNG